MRSSAGALKTTIDASGVTNAAAVRFASGEGRSSVLDGFTLTGGSGHLVSNGTEHAGGGVYVTGEKTSPTIINNIIRDNSLPGRSKGGAICIFHGAEPLIRNNVMVGNKARFGGAFYGCTRSATIVRNCILWGNGTNQITNSSCSGPPTFTVTYSDVQGGWTGTGNISLDPQFLNYSARCFRLKPTSPCIDKGDPNTKLDPDGTRADIGAFYYPQISKAYYKPFGSGCAGKSTPPTLKSSMPPRLGQPFTLEVGNLKPATGGVIMIGDSDKTWNGTPLPLDLTVIALRSRS